MKIKFLIPALLFCFFLFPSKSYAFETISKVYSSKVLKSNMSSIYGGDSFHIPPHSDDSTNLVFYYPLDRESLNWNGGRVYIHFQDMPQIIISDSAESKLSTVATYELSLLVAGQEYPLSANYYINDSSDLNPFWQSGAIYDWQGDLALKFIVHLTYTNMDAESVITSFNFNVPTFNYQIHDLHISNEKVYLKNIENSLSLGFSGIIDAIDSLADDMVSKFNEVMNGFDDSAGNQINSDFNDTVADLDEAEDNLFELASNEINYQTYEDFFALSSVEGAIAFVSSWMQSIYTALGVFGMPILIGLVLLVVTRIIGYQNFSAGGG